jgi:hypothetical protein
VSLQGFAPETDKFSSTAVLAVPDLTSSSRPHDQLGAEGCVPHEKHILRRSASNESPRAVGREISEVAQGASYGRVGFAPLIGVRPQRRRRCRRPRAVRVPAPPGLAIESLSCFPTCGRAWQRPYYRFAATDRIMRVGRDKQCPVPHSCRRAAWGVIAILVHLIEIG